MQWLAFILLFESCLMAVFGASLQDMNWLADTNIATISQSVCKGHSCTYNFTVRKYPHANLQIKMSFGEVESDAKTIYLKISKMGEQAPFDPPIYQDIVYIRYQMDDHKLFEKEKEEWEISALSEMAHKLYFNRGDFIIRSNKKYVDFMLACPELYFVGLGFGVRGCIKAFIPPGRELSDVELAGMRSYRIQAPKIPNYFTLHIPDQRCTSKRCFTPVIQGGSTLQVVDDRQLLRESN